jgi:hypothetical protein
MLNTGSAEPAGIPAAPAYPAELVEMFMLRTQRAWYLMKQRAETLGGGWQRCGTRAWAK